jgi:hypothetical protein
MMTYAQDPVMLHEFLHVYHARLMPQGYDNRGILAFYAEGKSKNFYPKEAYVLKNNREFRPARTRLTNPTRGAAEREVARPLQISRRRIRI